MSALHLVGYIILALYGLLFLAVFRILSESWTKFLIGLAIVSGLYGGLAFAVFLIVKR